MNQQQAVEREEFLRSKWIGIVSRVSEAEGRLDLLEDNEKAYFAVQMLIGEVYSGGFSQYFINPISSHHRFAELALLQLGARHSLNLLREAKKVLFGDEPVPADWRERQKCVQRCEALSDLETEFYKDKDKLEQKVTALLTDIPTTRVLH